MRILVLTSTFPRYEGDHVPEFVLELSKNVSRYAEVSVLAPHDRGAKLIESLAGLRVYRFPYFIPRFQTLAYRGGMVNRFRESFLAKLQLPFYLSALLLWTLYLVVAKRIDVIHAHWLFPQGFIAAIARSLTGRKLVITTHGGDVALMNDGPLSRLFRFAIRRADKVTYVSKKNLSIAREKLGDSAALNAAILPMGIYPPRELSPKKDNRYKKILFIGRIVAIKGLRVLLQALAIASRARDDLRLAVLGDGPEKESMVQLCRELGLSDKASFEGYVRGEQKDKFLQECDIVAVPSIIDEHGYEEGLPVVALEALSYGKILIATRTGGLPELLSQGNGILVEPNDPARLAAAILEAVEDPERARGIRKKARESSKEYSWQKITSRFMRLVDEITAEKRKVLLLSLGDKPSGPTTWKNGLLEHLRRKSVEAKELDASSIRSLLRLPIVSRYGTIHAYHVSIAALAYLVFGYILQKRIIFTVHGDIYAEAGSKRGLKRFFWLPFYSFAFRVADKVTFPSEFLYKKIVPRQTVLSDKSIVIYNGIELPQTLPARHSHMEASKVLSITSFTHHEKARGIIPLAASIEELRKARGDLSLTIVGGGRFLEELRQGYSSDHIHFTGFQSDVGRYLQDTDIFVHSSFLDNFPYTILEAVAARVPAIATRTGAIGEMLPPSSLVYPTAESISHSLAKLLASPEARERTAADNLQFIKKFSWDDAAERFASLYA